MKYYHRAIWNKIKEALDIMPAVFLNGPRQVGKSTMMEQIAKKYMRADYVTFDDISVFASASSDPEGFLRSFQKPVIIDEVQKVPNIYSSLKLLIDEYRQKDNASGNGRFLLTGSVNIMAVPKLSEALVGRMAIISLYPLSASEVLLEDGKSVINGWFDQNITFQKSEEEFSLDRVIHMASFPEIISMNTHARDAWFTGYVSTLLQRDVRDLAEIEKIAALPNMVKMLAARTGSILNNASFARDAQLGVMTYERYRVLLEQLFLITLVKPWYRNINLRLVRTPKVFFTDTALLCHQLGVDPATLKQSNPFLFGHILENFVFSELQKQFSLLSDNYTLYYLRVHGNKEEEVDFVIERKNGTLIGIEVKSNYSVDKNDFITLAKLKKAVGKDFVRGIVLYCGKDTLSFGEDMVAMPINQLWNFNMEIGFEEEVQPSTMKIKFEEEMDSIIPFGRVQLWAKYGDNTRIRCDIDQKTISGFFHNNPTEKDMEKVVKTYEHIIKPIFAKKIIDGKINTINHDHGANCIDGRYVKILQTELIPGDFGYKDFRNING